MDIPSAANSSRPNDGRVEDSFADSLSKKHSACNAPQMRMASLRSSQATDLAAGLGFMSPNFMPAMGVEMLDALGLAEGVAQEMARYEEIQQYEENKPGS